MGYYFAIPNGWNVEDLPKYGDKITLGEHLSLSDGINDKEYQTNGTLIWKNV